MERDFQQLPPLLSAGIMELALLCGLVVMAGESRMGLRLGREGGRTVHPFTLFPRLGGCCSDPQDPGPHPPNPSASLQRAFSGRQSPSMVASARELWVAKLHCTSLDCCEGSNWKSRTGVCWAHDDDALDTGHFTPASPTE